MCDVEAQYHPCGVTKLGQATMIMKVNPVNKPVAIKIPFAANQNASREIFLRRATEDLN